MLTNNRRKLAVVFFGLSALALSACASNDDVARAQSTANAALQQAQIASQTAQAANQQAQAAAAAAARRGSSY